MLIILTQFVREWQWWSLYTLLILVLAFPYSLLLIFRSIKKLRLILDYSHNYDESSSNFPPGNTGLFPFVGETLQFIAAIYTKQGFYDFVQLRHLRYGNCFKTHIFGETHVFVSSTEAAKEILSNDLGKFTKRYIKSIDEVVGAQSLLCATHQSHKLIRGRLLDLFSSSSMLEFINQFDHLVVDTLATWEHKRRVVILDEALKITLKAMCKMLLSVEAENQIDDLQKDVDCVCQAMLAIPLKFPCTRFSKGLKARKRIMELLEKMIKERREENFNHNHHHHHKDCLQNLLATPSKRCATNQAPGLTDAQIKDNILTMIIAGQDTTASAITWMVKYLDENKGVLEALRDELEILTKKNKNKTSQTVENLYEMKYAAKVVKESLRMASVVPWLPRVALHDCKIQGFTIKKGWNINVDAKSMHLDPTLYTDPYTFNPSRFDDDPKPYNFLAFGAGGRTCLGMNLARAMMLIFLYRIITTYKWKVIDPDPSVEKWALFSRLKSGCPIEVTRL